METIVITAAANAAAQESARKACVAYVSGYEHDRATVAEMREYASCIARLHPAPMTDGDLVMATLVILAAILAAAWVLERVRRRANLVQRPGSD